jgi:hypothetical protein
MHAAGSKPLQRIGARNEYDTVVLSTTDVPPSTERIRVPHGPPNVLDQQDRPSGHDLRCGSHRTSLRLSRTYIYRLHTTRAVVLVSYSCRTVPGAPAPPCTTSASCARLWAPPAHPAGQACAVSQVAEGVSAATGSLRSEYDGTMAPRRTAEAADHIARRTQPAAQRLPLRRFWPNSYVIGDGRHVVGRLVCRPPAAAQLRGLPIRRAARMLSVVHRA